MEQNDEYLIGVDNQNRIKLWNSSFFENFTNIAKFKQSINSIALLENDHLAIGSCGTDKIEIWSVKNQSKILALNDHKACVNTLLSVSVLNKTFLISSSADKTIQLYDQNFIRKQTVNHQTDSVLAIKYNPQLQLLASNSTNQKLKIWSFSYKIRAEIIRAHYNGSIEAICMLENGLIATGADDSKIKIWKQSHDKTSFELIADLREHKSLVYALILLKNNSLVSGSADQTIKVWNQINGTNFVCVSTLNLDSEIFSLAIWESSLLMSGHADGTILILNQTSFIVLQTLEEHTYGVNSIVQINNQYLASGSIDNTINIWQKINETSFSLNSTLTGHTSWVNWLVVLPNHMFASASADNSIRVWNSFLECVHILNGHTNTVSQLTVLKNEYLISISSDKKIIVWNIFDSFSRLITLKTDSSLLSVSLFSNDLFITGDSSGSLQLWSASAFRFQNEMTLKEHTDSVSDLAFQKNGFLVSTSFDKTIKIWDSSFKLWSSVSDAHSAPILALKVKKNSVLISSSQDGTITFWNTNYFILDDSFYIDK